ncbi:uncharacterized protein isoform X2 [Choristoneura fumiferana]
MADQVGADINLEAATNLAEDVSYKLRQTISAIALHSEMMKKSRVDSWDVNTIFTLSDSSPVVGAATTKYAAIGEDKICCPIDTLVNLTEYAMTSQTYTYSTLPTVSVEWITDEKSLSNNTNISASLQNYYTKVARAILNLRKKPKELAVQDLTTNTRIGPIFPNLFNLAVLVLNDDNLNALNVPTKKPLQANVLDMVDALCSNPCCLDTNIQQQFQRLFPVMVSNILGNGSLADKMVMILTKITRTWPSFIAIGKGILFEYLSQGSKERLTPPMLRCVAALGRDALLRCLGAHLDYIDACVNAPRRTPQHSQREALLDVSTVLLRSEPTTFLEDFVTTDYTLYEILGDSIMPRQTIFPYRDEVQNGTVNAEKTSEEEYSYVPLRPVTRRSKVHLIPVAKKLKNGIHREAVFEPTKFNTKSIHIKLKSCRTREIPLKLTRVMISRAQVNNVYVPSAPSGGVVVASGLLNRFKYKLSRNSAFPIFGALTL